MDGGEVASGTDCTVILGTRLTPSKPFASVLASSIRLGLACCGETTSVVVAGARTTPDMSPAGASVSSTRSTADEVPPPAWPRLPRLLLLRRGGWRGQTRMLLFRHGRETSSSSPPPGELTTVVVAVALRGEEYHVVAAVEGHELEIPEAEHRPGLKTLLKTPHLELNGKLLVNTQQALPGAPTVGVSTPGGSLDRRVNLSLRVPAQMGWREMEHKGGKRGSCYPAPGGYARSRGYKRSRGRERERERACSSARSSPARPSHMKALDLPFIDARRGSRCTMGGCS
jgi:hypothetical protein